MSTLMEASRQWATRPSDQRFTSLTEMLTDAVAIRQSSHAKVLSSRAISCQPVEGDHEGLVCVGPNGGAVDLTHWSFGQLAGLADSPAGYLRKLPSPLAADCINYGLHVSRDAQDVGVLLYKNGGPAQLRAATGPNYGRIWNETIIRALVNRFGDGITGDFRVPGEFGKEVEITKDNTTLYKSDRDMFVFLADERHRIEIPNRRDGKSGSLARGFETRRRVPVISHLASVRHGLANRMEGTKPNGTNAFANPLSRRRKRISRSGVSRGVGDSFRRSRTEAPLSAQVGNLARRVRRDPFRPWPDARTTDA